MDRTIKLHRVRAHMDDTGELFLRPENAIVRLNQLKKEWGEEYGELDEVIVVDTTPAWGFR